jgi:hypothetical protein
MAFLAKALAAETFIFITWRAPQGKPATPFTFSGDTLSEII